MGKSFTMEYWLDEGWYIGRLKEIPGVFSQAETLEELKENIKEAYHLMLDDIPSLPYISNTMYSEIEVTL